MVGSGLSAHNRLVRRIQFRKGPIDLLKRRLRTWMALIMTAMLTGLAACSGNAGEPVNPNAVELKFMYWGSNDEKQAMEKMIQSFNASHSNIRVKGEHVPGDYTTKINTLMAANQLPDIAYLGDSLTMKWASEGRLLDLSSYYDEYPELKNKLKSSYLYSEPGKSIGNYTALEVMQLFYNKELFTEAGVPVPPADPQKAWTWDEFLEIAKKLTKDQNGKHPGESGFDPKNIVQYGFAFGNDRSSWGPLLASNGGALTDKTGKKYTLNRPESVEVFQKLQDLVFKEHVAPDLIQQQDMPSNTIRLQTRKVAMVVDGTWSLLDFSNNKQLQWSIGVLPKLKEPKTMIVAGATVIFQSTKHPKEALEFYLYHNNPEKVDLFKSGLWMPIEEKYYTDEQAIQSWANNAAHPPEFRQAGIEYARDYAIKPSTSTLRNWPDIGSKLTPGLDLIWTNKKTPQQALDELEPIIQPLLQGVYPDE